MRFVLLAFFGLLLSSCMSAVSPTDTSALTISYSGSVTHTDAIDPTVGHLSGYLDFSAPLNKHLLILDQMSGALNISYPQNCDKAASGALLYLLSYYPGNYEDIRITRQKDELVVAKRHSIEDEFATPGTWQNVATFPLSQQTAIRFKDLPPFSSGDSYQCEYQ